MSTDEYVPSEYEIREDFVWAHTRNFDCYLMGRSLTSEQEHYGAQFDAMIARIRRDAKAEALREAVEQYAITIPDALGYKVPAVTVEDMLNAADGHEKRGQR